MPDSAAPAYTYDVFISYSTQDKAWVRGELLQTIQNAGLVVCIDYKNFEGGVPTVIDIENKVNASRKVLLVLTPNYVESKWTEFETLLLQANDPSNRHKRLIPILKVACKIPHRIAFLNHINFTQPEDLESAWTRLLIDLEPPVSPAPNSSWFLAHPYAMPPNFTGRRDELQQLDTWLNDDPQHPLLVLRALGGFGKSALTWHWLNHEVNPQEWPQVVWWSFYESAADFNSFLRETYAYLTGRPPEGLGPRQQLDTLLKHLEQHPVLIVMDGFERELRAYSGMAAAYQGDESEEQESDDGRDCVNFQAEIFLRNLASLPRLRGKVLMSTRLRPRPVELHGGTLLQGCYEKDLTAMEPNDAVAFFRRQGIAGNRGEIEQACGNYGFHPLSLRLLAGYITQDFKYPGDIRAAASLDVTGDLVQRRNHVLARSYESLPPAGRQLLGRIACFRSPVAYEVLTAINQNEATGESADTPGGHSSAVPLQATLRDLINRGLLQQETCNRQGQRTVMFDLHPIVRRYAYDCMATTERTATHGQLRDYFATVPQPEQVTTLDDLAPVIELYHHMVRAGEYDEAFVLFRERISKVTYYQLGAYHLQSELLRALFPQGEAQSPQLADETAHAWTLTALANSYGQSGQPRVAVPLLEQIVAICEKSGGRENLAITFSNLAQQQLPIGALQAAEANLRRRIALCQEIEDEFRETIGHAELGRLLAYQGAWTEVERELSKAIELFEKRKEIQYLGATCAYRSLAALLKCRPTPNPQTATAALAAAQRALDLADEFARSRYPMERDYVRAHWLLGAAHRINGHLAESDTHLAEALTRCRTINAVDGEADILLDIARLRADQHQPAEALHLAQEALTITDRCGYVLQGADVRLFLAHQSLAQGDRTQALTHAQLAHCLATCDGGNYTYRVAHDEATVLLAWIIHEG